MGQYHSAMRTTTDLASFLKKFWDTLIFAFLLRVRWEEQYSHVYKLNMKLECIYVYTYANMYVWIKQIKYNLRIIQI